MPPYSPELNAIEEGWGVSKNLVANYMPRHGEPSYSTDVLFRTALKDVKWKDLTERADRAVEALRAEMKVFTNIPDEERIIIRLDESDLSDDDDDDIDDDPDLPGKADSSSRNTGVAVDDEEETPPVMPGTVTSYACCAYACTVCHVMDVSI